MVELRIVIPAKNEEKYLPRLLDSIKEQSYKDLEVIVADANSTDDTIKIAKKYGCKIVRGGAPDVGRNNGAKNCKAPIIFFIDSDTLLPNPHYLENAINEFNKRGLNLAGTLVKPISTNSKIKNLFHSVFYGIGNYGIISAENTKKPFMQVAMFSKTSVHRGVGGFPAWEYGEDSAFAREAVKKGYKFGVLKEVEKIHVSPRRIDKDGFFKSTIKYIYLAFLLALGHSFERGKTKIKYF